MISRNSFSEWMKENTVLSDSSIYKYSHAVSSISRDMINKGVINTDLFFMSVLQLDIYLPIILSDKDFVHKNTTGNNMYSNALKQYRVFRRICDVRVSDTDIHSVIENYNILSETDKVAIVKARIGQGVFKSKLLKKYNSQCLVTGLKTSKLLIASHIKPWAVSNNEERLSEENGLLLSPTFDKLFDCGMITFSHSGKMIISSQLCKEDVLRLNISESTIYDLKASCKLKEHLDYHRDMIYIK